jgi:hypothetical protein
MTDFDNRFGVVNNTYTEATDSVAGGNTLNFGPIDSRAAMNSHRLGEAHDETVVFYTSADITGSVTCKLMDSDTGVDGSFTDLVTAQAVVNPKKGAFCFIPFPKTHKQYVRAMLGAAQAGITAFLESGPQVG